MPVNCSATQADPNISIASLESARTSWIGSDGLDWSKSLINESRVCN